MLDQVRQDGVDGYRIRSGMTGGGWMLDQVRHDGEDGWWIRFGMTGGMDVGSGPA